MKRVCAAAVTLAALAFAAPAHADGFEDWEATGFASTPAFVPTLSLQTPPVVYDTIEVYRCPGGGACEATPLARTGPGGFNTAGSVPGDVFEAHWIDQGTVAHIARTPDWQGPLTMTQGPSVQGQLTVGAALTAIPGQWVGGWGLPWGRSLYDRLVVCRNPDGTDCFTLAAAGQPVTLEARWAGWYAFATTMGYSGHTNAISVQAPPCPLPCALSAIFRSENSVASAPVGPIAAAPAPTPRPLPATASIRARALRRDHRLSIARVNCPQRCAVTAIVTGGGKRLKRTLTVTGFKALTIPPRHGKLKVRVEIDGKAVAEGISRAR